MAWTAALFGNCAPITGGAQVPVEDLVNALQSIERGTADIDTTFRVGKLGTALDIQKHAFEELPEYPAGDYQWVRFRWRDSNGQVRVETLKPENNDVAKVHLWTGSVWVEWTTDARVGSLRPTPRHDAYSDAWGWFNQNDWPGIGGYGPLSELIAAGQEVELTATSESWTCSFLTPSEGSRVTVVLDRTTPPRLRSFRRETIESDNGIQSTIHFQVQTWDEYNGVFIPREAYRMTKASGFRDTDGSVMPAAGSIVRLVREQIAPVEVDPAAFSLKPLDSIEVINDFTLRMIYRPGDSSLQFDGHTLLTVDPIAGYFGLDPPEMAQEPIDGEGASISRAALGLAAFICFLGACFTPFARTSPHRGNLRPGVFLLLLAGATIGVVSMKFLGSDGYKFAAFTSPLEGERAHDFGEVVFTGKNVELIHDFRLTNISPETVQIAHITASCGCAGATVSQDEVRPGESVEVKVVMRLGAPTRRRESVWLDLGRHGTTSLQIAATVFREADFYTVQKAVPLQLGPQRLAIIATDRVSDDKPIFPEIVVPEGVSAQFGGWRQLCTRLEERGRPAAWIGHYELAGLPDDSSAPFATVSLPGQDPVAVNLDGRTWSPRGRAIAAEE